MDATPMVAERRYLTVAFCDLVGSTALSELLDPEELQQLLVRYEQLVEKVCRAYGGSVAATRGDGLLLDFGYPLAHGNDAERAVRAAIEIIQEVPRVDSVVNGHPLPSLSARIGITTGLVLIGPEKTNIWQMDHSIVGEAANLASRVQAAAQPNSILITRETLDLVEGLFDVEPVGPVPLKGISRLVQIFRVIGSAASPHRSKALLRRGSARMVGRNDILQQLLEIWDQARLKREIKIAHIIGEAGVGKSRLTFELRTNATQEPINFITFNCFELYSSTPLFPVINLIRSQADIFVDEDNDRKAEKLKTLLISLECVDDEDFAAIAELMGIADVHAAAFLDQPPLLKKKRQFRVLIDLFKNISKTLPTIVLVEDAHWLDSLSAELLAELATHCASLPLLILATSRPHASTIPLPKADYVVMLEPLSAQDSIELVRSIPGTQTLPAELFQKIANISDGLPFFVEQIAISIMDQISNPLKAQPTSDFINTGLPLTLTEILFERLDRFPGAKRFIHLGSAFGRSFRPVAISTILNCPVSEIIASLDTLVDAGMLLRQHREPEISYEFRHSLLQRAAYESMVQSTRQSCHGQIAHFLTIHEGEERQTPPEVLAFHLTKAEMAAEACRAWIRAGIEASRKSANLEAIEHFQRAMELIAKIDDAKVRVQLEINALASQIAPLIAVKGFSAPEVSECCQRGLAICHSMGDTPMVFPFLYAQFTWEISCGRIPQAIASAEDFLAKARLANYAPGQVIGQRLLGLAMFANGRVTEARDALEQSVRCYSAERDEAVTYLFGQSARVSGRSALSMVMFSLGRIDEALELGFDALQVADQLRHPLSTGLAIAYVGGWVLGYCGAIDGLAAEARRLIALSEEHNLAAFKAFGEGYLGWAYAEQGNLGQGIALLEHARDTFRQLNWRLSVPSMLGLLAKAKLQAGSVDEAAELCAEAKQMMQDGGERFWEPEILRIESHVLRTAGGDNLRLAEKRARQSIEIARELKAETFELRALLSLRELFGPRLPDSDAIESRIQELSHLPPINTLLVEEIRQRTRNLLH